MRKNIQATHKSDKNLPKFSHPGKILQKFYLEPQGISAEALAKYLDISKEQSENILSGKESLTKDIAHKVEDLVGVNREIWLGLQKSYEEYKETR